MLWQYSSQDRISDRLEDAVVLLSWFVSEERAELPWPRQVSFSVTGFGVTGEVGPRLRGHESSIHITNQVSPSSEGSDALFVLHIHRHAGACVYFHKHKIFFLR